MKTTYQKTEARHLYKANTCSLSTQLVTSFQLSLIVSITPSIIFYYFFSLGGLVISLAMFYILFCFFYPLFCLSFIPNLGDLLIEEYLFDEKDKRIYTKYVLKTKDEKIESYVDFYIGAWLCSIIFLFFIFLVLPFIILRVCW